MPSNRISVLLDWCAENGVRIDPRIQLVHLDSTDTSDGSHGSRLPSDGGDSATVSRGITVCSREDFIKYPCTLAHIPKAAVLSVRSCSLAREIATVPYGHGAHLALALALYGELLRGSKSRWFGYLQSLPWETVDIAMFWGVDDVVDLGLCTCSGCACSSGHKISGGHQCPLEVTDSSKLDAACTACATLRDRQNAKEWLEVTEADRGLVNSMATAYGIAHVFVTDGHSAPNHGHTLVMRSWLLSGLWASGTGWGHLKTAIVIRGYPDEIHQYYFNVVELTLRAVSNNTFQIGDHSPVKNGREQQSDGRDPEARWDPRDVSFSGFCHAYSLVSSRAFWVDAYHGLAMVPIADAFNHTNSNHVQMESDYDVCVECGSLAECEHDRGAEDQMVTLPSNVHPLAHNDTAPESNEAVDYLEMRTVQPIQSRCEVFNTYGSLSNAVLLSRYGFTLPENEFDTVKMVSDPSISVARLLHAVKSGSAQTNDDSTGNVGMGCSPMEKEREVAVIARSSADHTCDVMHEEDDCVIDQPAPMPAGREPWEEVKSASDAERADRTREDLVNRLLRMFACVARAWGKDAAWDEHDEGLVFNPESPCPATICLVDGPVELSHDLALNSDGKLSHLLWLLCVLVAVFQTRPHLDSALLGVLERVESDCESITTLTELKARLIRVQRYAEQLHHDGNSVGDVDYSSDSKHGSTTSLALPHSVSSSHSDRDYETESDGFTHVVTEKQSGLSPQPSSVVSHLSVTASRGSSGRLEDVYDRRAVMQEGSSETAIGDPARYTSSSFPSQSSQALSESFKAPAISGFPQRHVAGQIFQGTPHPFMTASQLSQATVSSGSRYRSYSAEGERPSKRARHCSHLVVDAREDQQRNTLSGRTVSSETEDCQFWKIGRGRPDHDASIGDTDQRIAIALAHVVVSLCNERYRPPVLKEEQRGIGMTAAELGDVLDETPEWMARTRSALQLVVGERSIVESCASSWGAMLG